MSRTILFLSLATLMALLSGCDADRTSQDAHGDDAHGGHSHASEPDDGRETISVTRWTERTELFMEYPVLVAGKSSRAAVHVTDLAGFSPPSGGQVVIALRPDDGKASEFRGGMSSPGIYGVSLEVDRPGSYEMLLYLNAPGLPDYHEIGSVTVHPSEGPLPTGAPEEDGTISFLKEQQWALDFGTAPVETRTLRSSITVPGLVRPRAGGDATLNAPVPGRIDSSSVVPTPGSRVRGGSVLARIVPRSDDLRDGVELKAALVTAEQRHRLAREERDRAARLVEARALPARRLDEADAALASSAAVLDAEKARWDRFESLNGSEGNSPQTGTFAIRAPFDGVITEVGFSSGTSVDENQPLVRLVDPDRLHIVGAVPEPDAAALPAVTSGELLRNGDSAVALGKPLTIGTVLEPVTRTAEIRFAFANRDRRLQIGQNVTLRLFVGGEQSGPAIPEAAIVDDGGQPVVFVQLDGESFERRPVRLGNRERGYVQVLEGVSPGERIVHRGAYLVRLAAMSTQIPAHGHVH